MRPNTIDVFWSRVDKEGTCWIWLGSRSNRYGTFSFRGVSHQAHRFSYSLTHQIPDGMELDHLCRNTFCVRPSHLEPVTHTENIRRGIAPTAINRRKTHCISGHEFTEENTYRRGSWRECWTCKRNRRVIAAGGVL